MLFRRRRSYTRTEILEAAGKAQARGRTKKAIAHYKKVLKANPGDHVVHAKAAPLFARTKQFSESWSSFRAAGRGYAEKGFEEKALGVYTQATRYIPREIGAWEAVTSLQLARGLDADAVKTLIKGHRNFTHRSLRPKAIQLLRRAREISPWNFEVTFELARLLSKTGEAEEALRLLCGLAERARGRDLRRVRGALLRLSPTAGSLWRWLSSSVFTA
ncbi:MAG: hypothetical protein BMS9Abin23_0947 [Thermodesulfobacteriota bacterium]|nr:MAG: hypothetical protein BMS9Abin23_0947 [Thermodesulfobacteriota bacterium]